VVDWAQGSNLGKVHSLLSNAALGLVAGGIAAILFILAQFVSNPADINLNIQTQQTKRLVPFAISVGFIAGLTLEAVFRKLRTMDVVRTEGLKEESSPINR
jgi:membrane protease YdiL (CAAX protease family)